ncbi:hypothetical protein Hanom_Chr01g00068661 [Helianthus anomalus]
MASRVGSTLVDNQSPIRPLHEHFLLLGWVCFSWGRGDRDWPVIRTKRERSAHEIRPEQGASEPPPADVVSIVDKSAREVAGSSGSQAKKGSILDDMDSDPEVQSLDEALQYRPSAGSIKSKGIASDVKLNSLVRK